LKPEERLRYVKSTDEFYFHIDSSQLLGDIEYILNNKIENIIINSREEYHLRDIDWLEKISSVVKVIAITTPSKGKFCFDGLKCCVGLQSLKINNYCNVAIDVSNNLNLKSLYIEGFKKVKGTDKLIGLENLGIFKAPKDILDNSIFGRLKKLKHLSISNVDASDGLDFLENSPVTSLWIFYCRKLSLKGIEKLNLDSFEVHNCKNIDNVESLYASQSLKEVKIIDSAKLKKADDFLSLENLETLILLGTSYFIDGDLAPLKGKLKIFNYDNKRHYTVKYEEFKLSHLLENTS